MGPVQKNQPTSVGSVFRGFFLKRIGPNPAQITSPNCTPNGLDRMKDNLWVFVNDRTLIGRREGMLFRQAYGTAVPSTYSSEMRPICSDLHALKCCI